jgi:nucleotide-binding universal stress UspA family protein
LTCAKRMSRTAHILVVVDPSARGPQSAVDKATHLARRLGASVEMIICDIASTFHDPVVPVYPRAEASSNAKLLDLLESHAAPARALGLNVAHRLIHGKSLNDALLNYIRDSNADLVVKDSHSLAKQALLTKTDWHLSRGCPVPLLLTKNRVWNEPPAIMAVVDPHLANKPAAALDRHILDSAASLAGQLFADLHVLHTFIPTAFAKVVAAGQSSVSREYSVTLQLENSFKYWQIEHLVAAYGVTRDRIHIEMGAPRDCSLRAVRQHHIDVLVMGASCQRPVAGRTASSLLESVPCDVLIVNPCDQTQAIPF